MQAAIDEARQGLSEGGIPIGSVLVRVVANPLVRVPEQRLVERHPFVTVIHRLQSTRPVNIRDRGGRPPEGPRPGGSGGGGASRGY